MLAYSDWAALDLFDAFIYFYIFDNPGNGKVLENNYTALTAYRMKSQGLQHER